MNEDRNWHKKRILRSQIWIRRNRFEDFKAPTQQAKMPVIDKADGSFDQGLAVLDIHCYSIGFKLWSTLRKQLPFHCRNGCLPTIHSMAMVVLKSVTLFMLCYHIFLGNLSLSQNSSFQCFFFCPIFRTVLSPSSFRSLPVGPCVIGSDRDWCLSMTAVVHCSTGDLWSPCPTTTTVSSSIFRRKIGLSEN